MPYNKWQQNGLLTAHTFWHGFAILRQKLRSVISPCAGRYGYTLG